MNTQSLPGSPNIRPRRSSSQLASRPASRSGEQKREIIFHSYAPHGGCTLFLHLKARNSWKPSDAAIVYLSYPGDAWSPVQEQPIANFVQEESSKTWTLMFQPRTTFDYKFVLPYNTRGWCEIRMKNRYQFSVQTAEDMKMAVGYDATGNAIGKLMPALGCTGIVKLPGIPSTESMFLVHAKEFSNQSLASSGMSVEGTCKVIFGEWLDLSQFLRPICNTFNVTAKSDGGCHLTMYKELKFMEVITAPAGGKLFDVAGNLDLQLAKGESAKFIIWHHGAFLHLMAPNYDMAEIEVKGDGKVSFQPFKASDVNPKEGSVFIVGKNPTGQVSKVTAVAAPYDLGGTVTVTAEVTRAAKVIFKHGYTVQNKVKK